MKHALRLLLIGLLGVVFLAGCGGSTEPNKNKDKDRPVPEKEKKDKGS